MVHDILNNDDCNINVLSLVDTALELTKLYYNTERGKKDADWFGFKPENVYETYKNFKESIKKDEKVTCDCDTCENYDECKEED